MARQKQGLVIKSGILLLGADGYGHSGNSFEHCSCIGGLSFSRNENICTYKYSLRKCSRENGIKRGGKISEVC